MELHPRGEVGKPKRKSFTLTAMQKESSSSFRRYLAQRYEIETGRSVASLSDAASQEHDWLFEWFLRRSLPLPYCYDGMTDMLKKVESDLVLEVYGIFWYLDGGRNPRASMHLRAEFKNAEIHYVIQITPQSVFSSDNKMWKTFYLYVAGDIPQWDWYDEVHGKL